MQAKAVLTSRIKKKGRSLSYVILPFYNAERVLGFQMKERASRKAQQKERTKAGVNITNPKRPRSWTLLQGQTVMPQRSRWGPGVPNRNHLCY